ERADRQTTRITVLPANGAPEFVQLDGWRVLEGQLVQIRTFVYDPDNPTFVALERLGDGTLLDPFTTAPSVSVRVVDGLPGGASFDEDTWIFSWIPGHDQAGLHTVTLEATDDGGGT